MEDEKEMNSPTSEEIRAALVYRSVNTWARWEGNSRIMPSGL
jgi:hypothetical protein